MILEEETTSCSFLFPGSTTSSRYCGSFTEYESVGDMKKVGEIVLECPICGKSGFSKQNIASHVELCLLKSTDTMEQNIPNIAPPIERDLNIAQPNKCHQRKREIQNEFSSNGDPQTSEVVHSRNQDILTYYSSWGIKVYAYYYQVIMTKALQRILLV